MTGTIGTKKKPMIAASRYTNDATSDLTANISKKTHGSDRVINPVMMIL